MKLLKTKIQLVSKMVIFIGIKQLNKFKDLLLILMNII